VTTTETARRRAIALALGDISRSIIGSGVPHLTVRRGHRTSARVIAYAHARTPRAGRVLDFDDTTTTGPGLTCRYRREN
jgi:hypothetical protein